MNIFLSYPHADLTITKALEAALTSGGHTVWRDDQLITGARWREQLADQIEQSDAVALAITPKWLASPYCQWEFITAVEHGKKVIPVLLDTVGALPDRLSQYQYADFRGGFADSAKVQKFLDDLVKLAVVVDKSRIASVDKTQYADAIMQQNQGGGHNFSVSGNDNSVVGGNLDQSRTNVTMSGSTVSGAAVNIGGHQALSGNTTLTYAEGGTSHDARQDVEKLAQQLLSELSKLQSVDKDEAEAIQALTQEALELTRKTKPNPSLLKIKGESLKQAAQNLLTVAPIAADIAAALLQIK